MTKVVFGLMTRSSVAVVTDCVTPCCVTLSGRLRALPSSAWKTNLTATGAEEVVISEIVVSQSPPAAMWDSVPARTKEGAAATVRLNGWVAAAEALSVTRTVKL